MRLQGTLMSILLIWAVTAQAEVHEKLTQSQYDVRGDDHSSLLSVVLHDQPKIKTSDEAIDAEEGMLAHALSSAASRGGGNPGRPVTCGLPAWGKLDNQNNV